MLRPLLLLCLPLAAQDAATFRALPKLTVQQVALSPKTELGTASSIAVDAKGAIYLLHRGDKSDPIVVVNQEGQILRSWGKGLFTVPHSIRIDPQGNVWTVDAGSSVLQKFTPEGKKLQEISVGEVAPAERCAFPTLCGTTDVAFGPNGRLYISDGYGNARILEYTADGKRVKQWGSSGTGPGQFQIPHGIATDGKVLYVADRTNARVQRFDLDGRYLGEWNNLGRPFALKFLNGSLWVAGSTIEAQGTRATPWLLKVDPSTGKILAQSESSGPHAIDVNASEEFFATGCCGGAMPNSFSWFRKTR